MTVISREEAAAALEQVGQARERVALIQRYRQAAPFLLLWGVIWVIADSLCDFFPEQGGLAWSALGPLGIALSFLVGWRMRSRGAGSPAGRSARWAVTTLSVFAYFAALGAIEPLMSPLQKGASISLFFALAYMLVGIWIGWRIFAVGVVMGAAIVFASLGLSSHQSLWIGLVSGGALIAGGLWLRKV